jgi:diguanylate cyclase (GGDEF)-like protein
VPVADADRGLAALLAVAEAFPPQRGVAEALADVLRGVIEAMGADGGALMVRDAGEPCLAEQGLTAESRREEVLDALRLAVEGGSAWVAGREGGGWVGAAPVGSADGPYGGLGAEEPGGDVAPMGPATGSARRRNPMGGLALTGPVGVPMAALLQALARQLELSLEAAHRFAELRAAASRINLANRMTAAITSGSDPRAAMPGFARELKGFVEFDRLACAFVNDSGDYIEVCGYPDQSSWGIGDVIPVVGSGPGSVVMEDRAFVVTDLLHQHRFIEDMRLLEEGLRSYMLLPLNARGRTVGALAIGSDTENVYGEDDVARLQPLVDHAALAFDNVRLLQKSRELSITDELTPLYNARFFHQILEREIKLVDRYKSVLSVVFIDLDRFKPVNDKWGHLRGSRVLREVGFLLRSAVRETDYPVRYGGDEFCVILPQTDGPAARALSEKLRSMVEEHIYLQEEGINVRVGASLGIASYPEEAKSKEALIRLADERMYQDKGERHTR